MWFFACVAGAVLQAPEVVDVASTSMRVRWRLGTEPSGAAIDAYAVEAVSLLRRQDGWRAVATTEGQRYERHEIQIIDVRATKRVTAGWFSLALGWETVTRPIPYDASAAAVREALEELGVTVRVRRCDEDRGGPAGWVGGCPFGAYGAYSWRLEFDSEASDSFPTVVVAKQTIDSWTGGPSVVVWKGGAGLVHASSCGVKEWVRDARTPLPFCEILVDGLEPGDLLAFRLREQLRGKWSEPGPPTEYKRVPASRAPGRPPPPVVRANAVVYASNPTIASSQSPDYFDVQIKTVEGSWVDAGQANVDASGYAALELSNVSRGARLVARTRAVNNVGFGDWSSESQPTVVSRAPPGPPPQPIVMAVAAHDVVLRWRNVHGGVAAFQVALQEFGSNHWTNYDETFESIEASPTLDFDEVQTITITASTGSYRLRLPGLTTQTSSLSFDAPAIDVASALEAAGLEPGVVRLTRRAASQYAGGIVLRMTFKHALDLAPSGLFPLAVAENVLAPLATTTGPVVRVERVRAASRRRVKDVIEATVQYLDSLASYRFRTRAVVDFSLQGDWSAPTDWIQTRAAAVLEANTTSTNVLLEGAVGWQTARQSDPDYVDGAGLGGRDRRDGGDGLAVLSVFDDEGLPAWPRAVLFSSQSKFFVPSKATRLVIKLWGAGGGGGTSSRGGGGAFVQAAFSVESGETLEVAVGGGGGGTSRTGGAPGSNGGGRGGDAGDASGGGGGGRTEVRRQATVLAVAAGGGGGSGTSRGGGGGGGEDGENGGRGASATVPGAPGDNASPGRTTGAGGAGAASITAQGGGGGGGGWFGGGGGGELGGGGGGVSYVDKSSSLYAEPRRSDRHVAPVVRKVDHRSIHLELPSPFPRRHVEVAKGDGSAAFLRRSVVKETRYAIDGLVPATTYRVRVRGANRTYVSLASEAVAVTTKSAPADAWTLIRPRRSRVQYEGGYGAASPVLGRPHYSEGAQILDNEFYKARLSKAAPPNEIANPSPRRGHTLTLLGDRQSVEALELPAVELNAVFMFGGTGPGYECDGAVGATFRFGSPTAGREVEDCFAGRGASAELWRFDATLTTWSLVSRSGPPARSGHVATAIQSKLLVWGGAANDGTLLDDLWQLDVGTPQVRSFDGSSLDVSRNTTTYSSINVTVSDSLCVRTVQVVVTSATALDVKIYGPGPGLVADWYASKSSFPRPVAPSTVVDLAERDLTSFFKGIKPAGTWTLEVLANGDNTAVAGWRLDFVLENCEPTYAWTNLTTVGDGPPPATDALGIAVNTSLFIALHDRLWRLDAMSLAWTRLGRADPATTAVVGRAATLTPHGVFAFGGYAPSHSLASLWTLADARDRRWRHVVANGESPRPRYRAGLAYLPDLDPPALLLFGGHDSTGELGDTWLYELAAAADESPAEDNENCDVHFRRGATRDRWQATCGASAAGEQCAIFEQLLVRAKCFRQYASLTANFGL